MSDALPKPADEAESSPPSPPPPVSLNHGGPGICRMCYPRGAPKPLDPNEQGELQL